MNDRPNVPANDDDPGLDLTLRDLGRFSPRQGFVERVVARVQVPLPAWARRIRGWFQSTFSGVTGWTVLVTFSLASAAAWGTAAVAGLRYRNEIESGFSWGSDEVMAAIRTGVAELVIRPAGELLAAVQSWAAGFGLPLRTLGAGYAMLAVVCTVALWRLMSEPKARRTINVVH
jgi:hypothetical protein